MAVIMYIPIKNVQKSPLSEPSPIPVVSNPCKIYCDNHAGSILIAALICIFLIPSGDEHPVPLSIT